MENMDFSDDFIDSDESDDGPDVFALTGAINALASQVKVADDDDQVQETLSETPTFEEESLAEDKLTEGQDINDIFAMSGKLDDLSRTLQTANSESNQLYSLFLCICQSAEMLINRNRSYCSFSVMTLALNI